MKGLDTSALLGLLHGDRGIRDLLKRLRHIELATTEANLLELAWIASRSPAHARRRKDALERLRQKITVLPIDSRAVERASRQMVRGAPTPPPLLLAMLGALDAAGCDELYTRDTVRDLGKWRFKVTRIAR